MVNMVSKHHLICHVLKACLFPRWENSKTWNNFVINKLVLRQGILEEHDVFMVAGGGGGGRDGCFEVHKIVPQG